MLNKPRNTSWFTASSDWQIVILAILLFLFLRWASWFIGLPPLEWVAVIGAAGALMVMHGYSRPFTLLILISVGSLLGNVILIIEDGLVPFSLFQIAYIFAIGVFIIHWFSTGFKPVRITGFELELALFFSIIFLSLLWVPDAERGFLHAIRVVMLSGLLFLFVNWIHHPRQITWILTFVVLVGALLGLMAVHHTINNPVAIIQDMLTDGTRRASRARIGQIDPNVFASLFFLPLAFTACISFTKVKIAVRIISALFFIVLLTAVMVTFSRSSWVSVFLMLVALAVLYRQYNLFLVTAVAGVIIIVAIPELRMVFMNILNRIIDLFSGGVDTSNYLRLVLFEGSFRIFFDSWLIGVGWRGFSDGFLTYYTLQETLGVYEPHNVIYLVFAELGIIGLLLFIFIVYKIFRIAWENTRFDAGPEIKILSHALLGTLIAYAVFYQFIGSGFTDNQLWITTGLAIALNQYLKSSGSPAVAANVSKPVVVT